MQALAPAPWHWAAFLAWGACGLFLTRKEEARGPGREAGVELLWLWALAPCLLNAMAVSVRGGFDVVWWSQIIFNVETRGAPLVTLEVPGNHLAFHFEPIAYVLGALRVASKHLMPDALFLVSVQALAALAIVAASLLPFRGDRARHEGVGKWLPFVILPFWGTVNALRFEFHPVTVGGCLGVCSLVLYCRGYRRTAHLFNAMTLACGELFLVTAPVQAAFFALDRRRTGASRSVPLLLGAFAVGFLGLWAYVHFAFKLWLDGNQPNDFYFLGRYAALGGTFDQVVLAPLLKPVAFLQVLATPAKIRYFAALALAPAAAFFMAWVCSRRRGDPAPGSSSQDVVAPLAAAALSLAAPVGKIALSTATNYTEFSFHYAADMLPGLGLAFWAAAAFAQSRRAFPLPSWPAAMAVAALVGFPSPLAGRPTVHDFRHRESIFPGAVKERLRDLPPELSVYCNDFQIMAELSARPLLYSPFTSVHVFATHPPDVLALGWPATQGLDHPDPDDFRRSFVLDGSDVVARTRTADVRYRLWWSEKAAVPGDVFVYRRLGGP